MPKINIALPKGKAQGDIDIDIHSGKDGNIEIPSCDIGFPKGNVKGDIHFEGPGGKGGR